MKKRFLTIAIAAGLAAPFAVNAGDVTVFGNVHVSIDSKNSGAPGAATSEMDMNSNTSTIGVKGKEDLGAGMTALFFAEWQIDVTERCQESIETGANAGTGCSSMTDRDQWVGLKSGMGTVKIGTVTTSYKKSGSQVDPMWRTQLEGRTGAAQMMSSQYHGGAGTDRGRITNAIQYFSPEMGGMQMIVNGTVGGDSGATPDTGEAMGAGFRYETKDMMVFLDWMDVAGRSSAAKVGLTYQAGDIKLGFQHEMTGDALGEDTTFMSVKYSLNSNDWVAFNFSMASEDTVGSGNDGSGYALMYNHNLSKRTNTYAGYGKEDMDDNNNDEEILTLGLRHKF